jgi:hypothetical protein
MPGYGRLAQLVEQLTLNQRVDGSSPSSPTIFFNGLARNGRAIVCLWVTNGLQKPQISAMELAHNNACIFLLTRVLPPPICHLATPTPPDTSDHPICYHYTEFRYSLITYFQIWAARKII